MSFPPSSAIGPGRDNRPLLIGACCAALSTLVPVACYQLSLIPKLPDPPLSVFDSEHITMSKMAHPLGIPDALLGLASFGTTLTLAILAGRNGTARKLLGVKLGLDASAAAFKRRPAGNRVSQALLVVHSNGPFRGRDGVCRTRVHSGRPCRRKKSRQKTLIRTVLERVAPLI